MGGEEGSGEMSLVLRSQAAVSALHLPEACSLACLLPGLLESTWHTPASCPSAGPGLPLTSPLDPAREPCTCLPAGPDGLRALCVSLNPEMDPGSGRAAESDSAG